MTDETIMAVLEQLLKEVEALQKKQPGGQGEKIEAIQEQISGLQGQLSSISRQIEQQTTSRDRTGEILSKLNTIQRQVEIREEPQKGKEKLSSFNLILWGTVGLIFGLLVLSIFKMGSLEKERDKFKYYSERKHDNFMKYRYLKLFGNQNTQKDIKTIDKLYQSKGDYYDSLIIAREIQQGKH